MAPPNRVSDFDPKKFTISGFCTRCDYIAPVPRADESMEVPPLIAKLSCTHCGSRDCSIRIVYTGAGGYACRGGRDQA